MQIFKSKYYNSIDNCPIGVFQYILKKGDLNRLTIKGKPSIKTLNQAWEQIYDEYLRLYGIPQSFRDYCLKKLQAGEMFAESIKEGMMWKRAIYEMLNEEAESLINQGHAEEFEKVLAITSKKAGFRLNPNEMSVREFYGYLNLAEDGK